MKNNKKPAFTLIELLVVIAIIGILSTLAVVALQGARGRARDAKRIADIKQMQTALELYFNDNGSYPTSITSTIATAGVVYMTSVPSAPTPADGSCTDALNTYSYSSDGSTYSINFCLGSQLSGLAAGEKIAVRDGILDPAPWACGDTLFDSRDSNQYSTVQIGTQCWMSKNLAYLPEVCPGSGLATTSPKYAVYGYNGTDVNAAKASGNYSIYGVLYNWYSAVNSETPGAQGVCPPGWHIPTVSDYDVLTTYVSNQYGCGAEKYSAKAVSSNSGWNSKAIICSIGWIQQDNNASGFNALPGGYSAYTSGGAFIHIISKAFFWTSNKNSTYVFVKSLDYEGTDFYTFSTFNKFDGFSVRCLKD